MGEGNFKRDADWDDVESRCQDCTDGDRSRLSRAGIKRSANLVQTILTFVKHRQRLYILVKNLLLRKFIQRTLRNHHASVGR